MPIVLSVLSKVGIAAMLWVGGHILLVGLDELGLSRALRRSSTTSRRTSTTRSAASARWLTNTAASALLGLVVGAIIVAVMHLRGRGHAPQH